MRHGRYTLGRPRRSTASCWTNITQRRWAGSRQPSTLRALSFSTGGTLAGRGACETPFFDKHNSCVEHLRFDTLHPEERDCVLQLVDFAAAAFSSRSSAECSSTHRRLATEAFWGTDTATSSYSGVGDTGDRDADTPFLHVLLMDGLPLAAFMNDGNYGEELLTWLLEWVSQAPREAWTMHLDAVLGVSSAALSTGPGSALFTKPANKISVATLTMMNRRHLRAVALACGCVESPEQLVYSAFAEAHAISDGAGQSVPSACASLRAIVTGLHGNDAMNRHVSQALGTPRGSQMLLRSLLLSMSTGQRYASAHSAVPLSDDLPSNLMDSGGSLWNALSHSPYVASVRALACGTTTCPLLSLTVDWVNAWGINASYAFPADHSSLPLLAVELKKAFESLHRSEKALLMYSEASEMLAATESTSRTPTLSNGEMPPWWSAGLLDATYRRRHITTGPSHAHMRHSESSSLPRVIVASPTIGLDSLGHLTSILLACDIACAALGIRDGSPTRQWGEARYSSHLLLGKEGTDEAWFCDALTQLRHLTRVTIARRFMLRAPADVWGDFGMVTQEDAQTAALAQLRCFPFLESLSTSLLSQRNCGLVVLHIIRDESYREAYAGERHEDTPRLETVREMLETIPLFMPFMSPHTLVSTLEEVSHASAQMQGTGHVPRNTHSAGLVCWSALFHVGSSTHAARQPQPQHQTLHLTTAQLRYVADHVLGTMSTLADASSTCSAIASFALLRAGNAYTDVMPLANLCLEDLLELAADSMT